MLGDTDRSAIRNVFADLAQDVAVHLALGDGEAAVTVLLGAREVDVAAEARRVVEEVASLSDRVVLTVEEGAEGELLPATRVADGLTYHGVPWGFELTTLVGAIAECGRSEPSLAPASRAVLAALDGDVRVEVYVTPT
jgi:alkyl hydroperoxide reductase subunit AhpF